MTDGDGRHLQNRTNMTTILNCCLKYLYIQKLFQTFKTFLSLSIELRF